MDPKALPMFTTFLDKSLRSNTFFRLNSSASAKKNYQLVIKSFDQINSYVFKFLLFQAFFHNLNTFSGFKTFSVLKKFIPGNHGCSLWDNFYKTIMKEIKNASSNILLMNKLPETIKKKKIFISKQTLWQKILSTIHF